MFGVVFRPCHASPGRCKLSLRSIPPCAAAHNRLAATLATSTRRAAGFRALLGIPAISAISAKLRWQFHYGGQKDAIFRS
jgi:hypothetical protein